jgi:hypothetical protein
MRRIDIIMKSDGIGKNQIKKGENQKIRVLACGVARLAGEKNEAVRDLCLDPESSRYPHTLDVRCV